MAENIKIQIVTPDKVVIDDNASIVMAPGSDGEFGVLNGHTPFLTALQVGTIHYRDESNKERYVFVNGGFAEALPDKVTILAESAERRRDIDKKRAEEAMRRAEERIESAAGNEDIDVDRARIALARATWRLTLSKVST
ncbi:MAG: F0F1 ATP synthase subunit epsilon [Deltaproteobacteria bacterium]|nr:F0F1 ATP synthase subunit epsilon [Deltaproteobacteria bacterium]MBW2217925.1 F0F1 ATP synthase subunit epsilon [Deltaproteobacteria bacterium]